MSRTFNFRLALPALLLGQLAAFAADPPAPPRPKTETVVGVIKEVRREKPALTFTRIAEGTHGLQEVTDFRRLADNCLITFDGGKVKVTDLRPGDRAEIEYDAKSQLAVRVAITSAAALEREKKKKEEAAKISRIAEDESYRMMKHAAERLAAERKKALEEKRKNDSEKPEKHKEKPTKDKDKDKGDAPPK
ncbi:MAG: hypothetical protein ACJ8F7_03885 [Gemmataceae bacterium]